MADTSIRVNVPTQLVVAPLVASILGFGSGLMTSTSLASLQFLAENAHCQPTTVQGWYFYQKTKNYRVILSGLKGGIKTGAKLGGWTMAFVGLQEGLCKGIRSAQVNVQGEKGVSGAIAAGGLTLAASKIYRLSNRALPKRLILGLAVGGLAGSLEDLRNYLRVQKEREESTLA